jgi:bacterioferritin
MATSLEPVTKVSDELKALLNEAIAREIQVSVQYMWQHVQVSGVKAVAVQDKFRSTAIAEMKHAEKIAERLFYFDVAPTIKPTPIAVGGDTTQMLKADVKAEEEAITLYKAIIKQADSEGDETTRRLFEEILSEEESHHDTFTTLLGQ